jgi:TatD DNase family protein
MNWIDVHVHLDKIEDSVDETLRKAKEAGVDKVITVGTEPADHPVVLDIAKKYYPNVYCTLGIHPHEGVLYTAEAGKFIEENLHHPWVVAVGEIGLDYYYNHSEKAAQIDAFRQQMEIAARAKMPVEIHTRDAEEDTVMILKEFEGRVNGLIHCFTGSQWLADQSLKYGYNISISGVVTFKNAESLRDTVKTIPLDRIHVETDSPFLAPVPVRGQKCTPAFVVHTAKVVAGLKGVSEEQLAIQTRENLMRLMPKFN